MVVARSRPLSNRSRNHRTSADLSEVGAAGIDVENAEQTVERLSDEGAPAVGADGQSAGRVRGGEPGERALPRPPSARRRPGLGVVVGGRRGQRRCVGGEEARLGRLADQHVARVRTEDADDVRLGLDELVQCGQQDTATHVHCMKHTHTNNCRNLYSPFTVVT